MWRVWGNPAAKRPRKVLHGDLGFESTIDELPEFKQFCAPRLCGCTSLLVGQSSDYVLRSFGLIPFALVLIKQQKWGIIRGYLTVRLR